jgi:hypothetical protein
MSGVQTIALLGGIGAVAFIVELVRRREIREKYALLWIVLGAGVGLLGLWPGLLDSGAGMLGVADPPNLLFFIALLVLLLIVAHLTWEVSRLEKETRTLAELAAIQRLEAEIDGGQARRPRGAPDGGEPGDPPGG